MNTGQLALVTVGLLIALAVFVTLNREVLGLVERPAPRRASRPTVKRMPAKRAETPAPAAKAVSESFQPIPKPNTDAEMISFRNAHKLIKSGKFTQTEILCVLFDVNPGGSKAYKDVVEKYKQVAAELDKSEGTTANQDKKA